VIYVYDITNVANDSENTQFYPSTLMIDETKYSSLRKLPRVIVYCFKFKIIQRCNFKTKVRIVRKHKVIRIIMCLLTWLLIQFILGDDYSAVDFCSPT